MRWDWPRYDLTYELDGDNELGSPMSIDVHGHIDFAEQELVVADIVEDEFAYEGYYLEVQHLWRTEHPEGDFEGDDRWSYAYTSKQRDGAIAVTRFQIASYWSHLCANHPDELAATGIPIQQIVESQHHLAEDGYVYLCRVCADRFRDRQDEARKAALALLATS